MLELLVPDWQAPPGVGAVVTTRHGGHSTGPYASANLGDHVGDDPATVTANRRDLLAQLDLPAVQWLRQVHGTEVVAATGAVPPPEADAVWTDQPELGCAVLTADCLPVLFASADGRRVAAAHAGWRGLAAGVLATTIEALAVAPEQLRVWLGPAIGPAAFQVGPEVRAAFLDASRDDRQRAAVAAAFRSDRADSAESSDLRYRADLYALARAELAALGVSQVAGGGYCTVSDSRFYSYRRSYRRDGITGRMATVIWRRP